ncbi:DNA-binding protein [Shigella dysenteriae]|nr:DNA-binding protein [Shigella dysenteriae]
MEASPMMEILRDGKINICEYINKEQLEKLNPPEDLRIEIKKLGWNIDWPPEVMLPTY